MGLSRESISIDIEHENIESILFSQNRCHVAITTSSYKMTMFGSREVKCVATVSTEGFVAHASQNALN